MEVADEKKRNKSGRILEEVCVKSCTGWAGLRLLRPDEGCVPFTQKTPAHDGEAGFTVPKASVRSPRYGMTVYMFLKRGSD